MSARVLAVISKDTPWVAPLGSGSACSSACGFCGGCSASWERDADDTEVCPDCLGSGEIVREDGSDYQVIAVCLECGGKGWID